MVTDKIRLNKHLALQLGISRREADELINAGDVLVNGSFASLGERVSNEDKITVKGKQISGSRTLQYIALNKPVGYVCSRKRQGDTPTIYELLPQELHHLKPVGRLDKDSSGLLLLTNDGDFAHKMTHPSFHKTKTYEITLDNDLAPLHQQMIDDHGVELEDGISQLNLSRLSEKNRKEWQVSMHEGRNRQIRRTFEALGYNVKKLHRITFGVYSFAKEQLDTGQHSILQI
ncbi:rRNA pseudouridine synthase [Candidatus Saccharibacteria bacterium]|nr:rRNA pseudouridine synthase [Candidatus Saccharibacteria bacterium]